MSDVQSNTPRVSADMYSRSHVLRNTTEQQHNRTKGRTKNGTRWNTCAIFNLVFSVFYLSSIYIAPCISHRPATTRSNHNATKATRAIETWNKSNHTQQHTRATTMVSINIPVIMQQKQQCNRSHNEYRITQYSATHIHVYVSYLDRGCALLPTIFWFFGAGKLSGHFFSFS